MYKFGFGLQPVIDGLAVSHSTLDVKFVSTKSDCMFQHRIWRGTWQHCSDGIHGHLNRLRTVARSENGFIRIEARLCRFSQFILIGFDTAKTVEIPDGGKTYLVHLKGSQF